MIAGNRNWNNGQYYNQGSNGYYWSSSPNSTNSYNANFNSGGGNIANNNNRGNGFSLRCLKNQGTGAFLAGAPVFSFFKTMDLVKIFQAYYDCRKNKRNTANALRFELDYESHLIRLHREIQDRTYRVGKSIAFIVNRPVKREIFAGDFRDRIVHHYVANELVPVFEKLFVHDSYSCRKGKGTLFGIRRMERFMRATTDNFTRDSWILKLDIMGFFMSIDRSLLLAMVEDVIREKYR